MVVTKKEIRWRIIEKSEKKKKGTNNLLAYKLKLSLSARALGNDIESSGVLFTSLAQLSGSQIPTITC